jgi:hypothetical protein
MLVERISGDLYRKEVWMRCMFEAISKPVSIPRKYGRIQPVHIHIPEQASRERQ